MAGKGKDDKPGHERGKVSGGSASGTSRNPDQNRATTHVHSWQPRDGGGSICSCGETT